MPSFESFYSLHSHNTSLVLDCRTGSPVVLYFGSGLSDSTRPEMLATLSTRQELPTRAEREAPIALSPEATRGFLGRPGIQIHRQGQQWMVSAELQRVKQSEHNLELYSYCPGTQIEIVHRVKLDFHSDVLVLSTELINQSSQALTVDQCNAPSIPLASDFTEIIGFTGRWSLEFQSFKHSRTAGSYLRENRAGRTSHDSFPGFIVHPKNTGEHQGQALAFHLGWSGNHRIGVEELSDGRAFAQLGELFYPGEIILHKGASYQSPELFVTHADQGLNQVSHHFHRYVRDHLTAPMMKGKEKLVHFNSWEAVYFDLSIEKLCRLADIAAEVGAERFVLDDGWFRHRRDDTAGLGDWYVDEGVFPEGLAPLADHLSHRGLEFGLWVEPEMVNPDSDLYRSHPDWALQASPAPQLLARQQLVLDLTRQEVQEYLLERLDSLLSEYPITYLKWDMNREIHQPGSYTGAAVVHLQTRSLYTLLERLRVAHPTVEIESCSSGGGRADFGILQHTDRVWTSDSNDALDRLQIQQGFSMFFPIEFMGAHVGPADCHITGRKLTMDFRCGVALFGDMGIEANLLEIDEDEKEVLSAAVALHKEYRQLIFTGDRIRLETAGHEQAFGVISKCLGQALFSYTLLTSQSHSVPGRLKLAGLDVDRQYQLSLIWPSKVKRLTPSVLDVIEQSPISGAALMYAGMQLPDMFPQSQLIFKLAEV